MAGQGMARPALMSATAFDIEEADERYRHY